MTETGSGELRKCIFKASGWKRGRKMKFMLVKWKQSVLKGTLLITLMNYWGLAWKYTMLRWGHLTLHEVPVSGEAWWYIPEGC